MKSSTDLTVKVLTLAIINSSVWSHTKVDQLMEVTISDGFTLQEMIGLNVMTTLSLS